MSAGFAAAGSRSSAADDLRLQVMWNRLISVVEEQAITLVRTAFSTVGYSTADCP